MNEDILLPYIRAVTKKDEGLPKFSYSKIEQFLNCPMAYDLKYNQEKHTLDTSLALEIGSLLHKVLEYKGHSVVRHKKINYTILDNYLENGIIDTDEKTKEVLLGVKELKKKYWESWSEPDSEGNDYNTKIDTFKKVLQEEMEENDGWKPVAFEQYFQFVWDNKVILHGFIDRIDKKDDEIRVVDYKSSKKVYDNSKLVTSLQFGIYAMACMVLFGKKPTEYLYRFVLLDESQKALSLGWEKRIVNKLTKVFADEEQKQQEKIWKPNPSPLCYFCNYCKNNPNAKEYKDCCKYYSLWTPNNKSFAKNKEWSEGEVKKPKRQLIF